MPVRVSGASLAAVLGGSHESQLPLSYVEREAEEQAFARALATQAHIVVFGTPGVGKSALIRHNVDWTKVVFVECISGQRAPDVYRSMLSEAGARIKTETRLSSKKRWSATLRVLGGDFERDTENLETEVTIDLGNIGDVFRILRSRNREGTFVVLNNFHVLARGVQRRIVSSLQYVAEHTDTRFIIVGNWTSPAYLADLNSLLPSFVTDVYVTPWSDEELRLLLGNIARLLNISLADDIAGELVRGAVGSVRELTDKCRRLLSAVGVLATQDPARVIREIDTLRDISGRAGSRLHERYAALLSDYFTTKLYSAEGADVDWFLEQVAEPLIGPEGAVGKYSLDELRLALDDVIDSFNEPRLTERARRTRLLGELAAAIRGSGSNRVSVTLRSIVEADNLNAAADQYALRDSAKKLVQLQAEQGFRPALLAYDPRGAALIAMEPKFRAFLRDESVVLGSLHRDDVKLISQIRGLRHYWKRDSWRDAITEAAKTRRWLVQHAAGEPTGAAGEPAGAAAEAAGEPAGAAAEAAGEPAGAAAGVAGEPAGAAGDAG